MRKRPVGFWSRPQVQSIVRLAVRGKLCWNTAAHRVNAMTPGTKTLNAAHIR